MIFFDHPLPCPKCKKIPGTRKEWPRFGSRELYYIECKPDGIFASGTTPATAGQAWERVVARFRFENRVWTNTQ